MRNNRSHACFTLVRKTAIVSTVLFLIGIASGCGGGSSGGSVNGVSISPSSAVVPTGGNQQFSARVSGGAGGVRWSVNGVEGGSALTGTISSSGEFTAPSPLSSSATITVPATSTADSSMSASASVTVLSNTISIGWCSAALEWDTIAESTGGGPIDFIGPVTVSGTSNTAYALSINGVPNGGGLGTLAPGH